jgi:O-antigen ligase
MSGYRLGRDRVMHIVGVSAPPVPSGFAEYFYFGVVIYGTLGETWGLSIPLLGAGGMAVLATYCVWRLGSSGISIYKPIALPLGCAISFLIIQIVIYDMSLMDDTLRVFVTWILGLIIIHSLSFRPGFFHRFALAALGMGALLLPYIVGNYGNLTGVEVERAGLEHSIGLANPNDLAAWFGFLSIYFVIFGMETKRNIVRIAAWLVVTVCLFVVGLTVSRGALIGIALSGVVSFRRLLKRHFLPVLCLTVLGSLIFFFGLFDHAIRFYTERGTEETGRLLIWPLAIEGFFASPIIGIGAGASDQIYLPDEGIYQSPHNTFLYLALASGVVPLAFYVAYWIKAVRGAYHLSAQQVPEAPFQLPLLIYTFVIALVGNGSYMFPWSIVTLSTAMLAGAPRPVRRLIVSHIGSHKTVQPSSTTR